MNYEELKLKIYDNLELKANDFLVYGKIENLLKTKIEISENNENYTKLAKQLSYDFLVKKRRGLKREDLEVDEYQCENPANFPEENDLLDKVNLIDPLTAWTEEWEDLACCDINFKYLKNLDANIMILCKDSTGKETYKEYAKKLQPYPKGISDYINKLNDINPFEYDEKDSDAKYLNTQEWRYGFSPDVKNNRMLRDLIHSYLDEQISTTNSGSVIPKENQNIFMTNSFVFLSASEKTSSIVPDSLFKMSVEEYIVPLLDIIKPKCVIQGGGDAVYYSINEIHNMIKNNIDLKNMNQDFEKKYKIHKKSFSTTTNLLKTTHINMKEKVDFKEFIYSINWDNEKKTLFFPSFHPSMPKYYKLEDGNNDSHYVWKYIKEYL